MTDTTATARIQAKNSIKQFGLACEYTDSRGFKISTYCTAPRKYREDELEYYGIQGQDRITATKVPMSDLGVVPAEDDEIEISETTSAQHCGTYRAQHVVPDDDQVEAFLVVHKLP